MLKTVWQSGSLLKDVAPRDPDELHTWIRRVLGFHIPRVSPTEGMSSPFSFVSDAFFHKVNSALVLASRGSSKTRCAAVLNLITSKFYSETHTIHFGAVERQGSWGHHYLRGMLKAKGLMRDVTQFYRDSVTWRNDSWVKTSSGASDTGVVAIRGNRLVQDEIDLWDMQLFDTSQMMVQGDSSHPVQRIYLSTRYTAGGLMNRLLNEADARRLRIYKWDVFSSLARCKRCREDNCPLFVWENPTTGRLEPLCRGRGLRADGWVPLESVVSEFYAVTPSEWATQKLLEEPSRENLLYPSFDRSIHVGKAPPEALSPRSRKFCGVDWGFSPHPLVFTVFAEGGDMFWGIHEHGELRAAPSREGEIAQELEREYGPELPFYCGADNPAAIQNLAETGLIVAPCPVRSRDARHRAVRRMLAKDRGTGLPRLMLDEEAMSHTIQQLGSVGVDSKTGQELRENDDYADSLDYALATVDFAGDVSAGGGFMA